MFFDVSSLALRTATSSVLAALVVIVAACFSVNSLAQDANSTIAVVDIQVAILQSERAQSALEALKKQDDFKDNLKRIESLEKEYKSMVESYKKDRAVMSATKREEEEKRIVDKQNDLKYLASKLQQVQKEWGESMMAELGEKTQTILKNLVQERNIGILLRADSRALLHADKSYDITLTVTERLNQAK